MQEARTGVRNGPGAAPEWNGAQPSVVGALERLTAQEQACLRLVARRLSSKEIAAELGIAKTSVDTYCNRARQKLGVSDRYAAARLLVAETTTAASAATPEPGAMAKAPPPPARRAIALAALGLAAAALAVASLLAGMAALEELRPPDRPLAPPVSPGVALAGAHAG